MAPHTAMALQELSAFIRSACLAIDQAAAPGVVIVLLHDDDRESHIGMRGTAKFGARGTIAAGARWRQREIIGPARNHVHLAAKRRNPERMNNVGCFERKSRRSADGQANFVGGLESRLVADGRIANAPPELLPRHLDRPVLFCKRVPRPYRRHQPDCVAQQKQKDHSRKSNATPGNERASLFRRPCFPSMAGSVKEQEGYAEPNRNAANNHDDEQPIDRLRFLAGGAKRGLLTAATRQNECTERNKTSQDCRSPFPPMLKLSDMERVCPVASG